MSALSVVNVVLWPSERVSSWIKGLDNRLSAYADNFSAARVTGTQLLVMTNDDLYDIGITKVGHQEMILNLIRLLDGLCSGLEHETLLFRTLQLSCRARSLYCELNTVKQKSFSFKGQSTPYDRRRQLYLAILVGASDIAGAVKKVCLMFDKIKFENNQTNHMYTDIRNQLIVFGLNLLGACRDGLKLLDACQDHKVTNELERVMSLCHRIHDLCESVITNSEDPLVIHCSSLELVTIHKKTEEDLSNASACKKIKEGDEVVYVNGHTVIGWSQQNIVMAFKDNQKDVTFLLKKYPNHMSFAGFTKKPKVYKELPKLSVGTKLRRSYGREKSSQLSSQGSLDSLASLPDHSVDDNASDNDVFHVYKDISTSSVHFTDIENKLRRVTVSGGSPTRLRSPLSAMDLATVRSASDARPKSFFPQTDRAAAMVKPVKDNTSLSTNHQRSEQTHTNEPSAIEKSECLISLAKSHLTSPVSVSNSMSISLESSSPTCVCSSPARIISHSQGQVYSTSATSVPTTSNQRSQPVSHSSTSLMSPCPAQQSPSTAIRSHLPLTSSSSGGTPQHALSPLPFGNPAVTSSGGTPQHALSPLPFGNPAVTSPINKHSEAALSNEIAGFGDCGTSPQLLSMFRIDSFKRHALDEKDRLASASSLSSLDFDSKPGSPAPSSASGSSRRTPLKDRELSTTSQSPSGLLRKKNFLQRVVGVNRRISCKDLGGGDCQGWLWKKKNASGLRAGRWVKFWFVLQQKNLYYYKGPEDVKAEGAIHLVGFQVSPTDSHSKKYAFKASKLEICFTFAAERQDDMAKWMNKIGLASLLDFEVSHTQTTAGFAKPDKTIYEASEAYFSESDDDLSPETALKENLKKATNLSESREDLSEFYQQLHQAKNTLTRSFQDKVSTLLRGVALDINTEDEKCRHLLSLKRTLTDKERDLGVLDGFLSLGVVTSPSLHSFVECNQDMLSSGKASVSSEDVSSTSCSDSETLN